MNESVTFLVTEKFKEALEKYCKDRNISMSSFIKGLVAKELIEEKYLEVDIKK